MSVRIPHSKSLKGKYMKPNKVWIGDPYYVLPLEMWDIFLCKDT